MKKLLAILVLISFYQIISAQNACTGPLNLDVNGSSTGTPLEIQYIADDIYCVGSAEGTIQLIIQGGSPEYKCVWSTGEENESISNLMPGMYSVTVTDFTGCAATLDIPVSEMTPLGDQLTLAEYTGCGECFVWDGQASYIYQDDEYMIHIRDIEDGVSLEAIEVCINVNDESYFLDDDKIYLKRSYAFKTNDAKSRIRLFFNEEELQELAIDAGVTVIDTNTLSVQRYISDTPDQQSFDNAETIRDITFNLFDSDNFIWEISFIEDDFSPDMYTQYFIQLENEVEEPPLSSFDPEEVEDASFYLIENPVMDWVQLETEDFYHVGSGNMKIINAAGQQLHVSAFDNRLIESEKINVSDFPSGVYFFVLEYSDIPFSKTFKFIKI